MGIKTINSSLNHLVASNLNKQIYLMLNQFTLKTNVFHSLQFIHIFQIQVLRCCSVAGEKGTEMPVHQITFTPRTSIQCPLPPGQNIKEKIPTRKQRKGRSPSPPSTPHRIKSMEEEWLQLESALCKPPTLAHHYLTRVGVTSPSR